MKNHYSNLSINTKASILTAATMLFVVVTVVWFYGYLPYEFVSNSRGAAERTPDQTGLITALIAFIALLPSTLGGQIRTIVFRYLPFRLPDPILRLTHSFLVALSFAAVTLIPSLVLSDWLRGFGVLPITIMATVFITTLIWRIAYPLPLNAFSRDGSIALDYFGYNDTIHRFLSEGKRYAAVQFACRRYEVDFDAALTVVCLHDTRKPEDKQA